MIRSDNNIDAGEKRICKTRDVAWDVADDIRAYDKFDYIIIDNRWGNMAQQWDTVSYK